MTSFRPSRGLVLLFLAQALATGATTASTVLASLVIAGLGHEALAGLPSTLVTLAAAASAGLFGLMMLRVGRRAGLVSAYLLGTLGAVVGFLGGRAGNVPVFLLGAALIGAAQGGYQQARYAVAESVPEGLQAGVMGVMMLASVLGSAASGALSGPLAVLAARLGSSSDLVGWLLAGAFLLLGAALTLFWRPLAPTGGTTTGTTPTRPAVRPARLSDDAVRWPALAVATAQGLMVTLMSLTPLRAHHMGMDHTHVAGLITLHVAGMFGFGWLTGPLLDRLGSRFGYVTGAALLAAASLTALLTGAWLPVSMFVLGLGWNLCYVAGSKALTAYAGVQGQVDALGYLAAGAGTLIGGAVIARYGFAPLSAFCAACALLPLLSAALAPRPSRAALAGD
ncbi:MFS transporter [Deinococcus aquiradiocola]|nr:MFS transporter [Deinococcus aquiradiocola]